MIRAVKFWQSKIGKFVVHSQQKMQYWRRSCSRNYSNTKEPNPLFRYKIKALVTFSNKPVK